MKKSLFGSISACLGLLAGLALVEGFLRAASPYTLPRRAAEQAENAFLERGASLWARYNRFLEDKHGGKIYKPSLDLTLNGPAGKYRFQTVAIGPFQDVGFKDIGVHQSSRSAVIVLGDSFAAGAHLPTGHIFPTLLESKIGAPVLNLAVEGTDISQHLKTLFYYALPLQPALVILSFCPNDLSASADAINESLRISGATEFVAALPPNPTKPQPQASESGLLSSVHRFLRTRLVLYHLILGALGAEGYKAPFDSREPSLRQDMELDEAYWENYLDLSRPGQRQRWSWLKACLRHMNRLCLSRKARLMVVYCPYKTQAHSGDWQSFRRRRWDLDGLSRWLAALCAELRIPYLDMTPAFRQAAQEGRSLFFPIDGHWTKEGHALAAATVANSLLQRHLVTGGQNWDNEP